MCKTHYSTGRNTVHFGESNDSEMRFSFQGHNSPVRDTRMETQSLICMTGALTEVHTECRSIMEDGLSAPCRWGNGWNLHLKGSRGSPDRVRWGRDMRQYKWGRSYCHLGTIFAMWFQWGQLNPSSQMSGPGFRSVTNYPFPSWTAACSLEEHLRHS